MGEPSQGDLGSCGERFEEDEGEGMQMREVESDSGSESGPCKGPGVGLRAHTATFRQKEVYGPGAEVRTAEGALGLSGALLSTVRTTWGAFEFLQQPRFKCFKQTPLNACRVSPKPWYRCKF